MSALLPAPRVSSPALLSLYHTLLITAMSGPLSQRMPSSFFGAMCSQEAALRLAGLFESKLCQKCRCLLKRTGQPVSHLLLCSSLFKGNLKNDVSSLASAPLWGTHKIPDWYQQLLPPLLLLLLLSCSLWPIAPLFHTAVYYFDQYPALPLLLLPLSLSLFPPPLANLTHTHFLRPVQAEGMVERSI